MAFDLWALKECECGMEYRGSVHQECLLQYARAEERRTIYASPRPYLDGPGYAKSAVVREIEYWTVPDTITRDSMGCITRIGPPILGPC